MKKTHHTSYTDERCKKCGRRFKMYWYDKEEKNGKSETSWGGVCIDCRTKENNGKPPLGLYDLNEIRKRGISKEQYYKEKGY